MLDVHLNIQMQLANSFMDLYAGHDQAVVDSVVNDCNYHGLIFQGDLLAGFAFLKVDDDKLHLAELYVDDRYRRQGIATTVVRHLDTLAKDFDVKYITLGVNAHNPAMSLYNKNGFVPRYVEMVKEAG